MTGMVLTTAWLLWLLPAILLVFAGLMRMALAIFMGGVPGVREGWITGVVGRMGQGKSLYIMTLAKKHLRYGGTVISNFAIDTSVTGGDWIEFRGWVALLEALVVRLEAAPLDKDGRPWVQPALVLLDEAHLYAPANGMVLPDVARWILSHLRKLRAEMMWCSQHESRVASALREQTAEIVSVRRQLLARNRFTAAVWEPEKFRKKGEDCLFKVSYSLNKSTISMYKSWQLIRPDEQGDSGGIVSGLIDRLEALAGQGPVAAVEVSSG
jgi:hypothetical protein